MGFCVNIDLIWIKNNYFFWRDQEKKPVNFQIAFCVEIKNYWRNITFWTYHPHHPFCDSRPKMSTSAHPYLPKKWNALYKKHAQVNIQNLSRGWKSTDVTPLPPFLLQMLSPSTPNSPTLPLPLFSSLFLFSTAFLAKHVTMFIF